MRGIKPLAALREEELGERADSKVSLKPLGDSGILGMSVNVFLLGQERKFPIMMTVC